MDWAALWVLRSRVLAAGLPVFAGVSGGCVTDPLDQMGGCVTDPLDQMAGFVTSCGYGPGSFGARCPFC